MTDSEQADDAELPTWQIVVAVAAAVVLLVGGSVVAWLLFGDDDGPGIAVPSTVERPDGEVAGLRDRFEREGGRTLGATEDGREWNVVSGTWGIDGGEAAVVTPNPDGPRSIAVVDMGGADGTVRVEASAVAQGWGLVFRYRGTFNFWMIVASPDYATYNVQKVVDGAVVSVGTLGLASTRDGTELRVDLLGPSIDVFVDGDLAGSFSDPHLQGATQVGMVAQGAAAELGRWDDFAADAAPGSSTPAPLAPAPLAPAPVAPAPVAPTTAAPVTAAPSVDATGTVPG